MRAVEVQKELEQDKKFLEELEKISDEKNRMDDQRKIAQAREIKWMQKVECIIP